jgi:hypothetical protein
MLTQAPSRIDTAGPALRFGDAPSGPVSPEPPADADDLGWDVPDEDEDAGRDDENFDPDDDSDLELDGDEDEVVGLDNDTGFEDAGDDLELDDGGKDEDEDERWTLDSEPSEDELPGADDADLISGEEYGWISDDEPSDDDDDLDVDLDEDALPSLDDGGAEGVEDDTDLDDLELGVLPDLDTAAEEEAEGFVTENIEEFAGVILADEPTLELVPGQQWKQLTARAAQVTRGASLPAPPLAFAVTGTTVAVSAGDGWFRSSPRGGLARLPVDAPPGRSVALAEHEGRLVFALASPAGLFVSLDGGRSFEQQRENDPPAQVALTQAGGALKIWARSQKGQLSVSEDAGKSFTAARLEGNLLAFATDGERRFCALVKRASRIVLGSSSDSGRRWNWVDAADSGNDASPQLLPGRGVSVIATRERVSYVQTGQPLRALAPLLQAPAALVDEDDETFVYACVPHEDQTLIVRTALRSGAQPMIVTSLARDRIGEPRFLSAAYAEGGFVTLSVATDQALLRIEASLDGDDLP